MRAIPSVSGRPFRSGRRAGRQRFAWQEDPRFSAAYGRRQFRPNEHNGTAVVAMAVRADRVVVGNLAGVGVYRCLQRSLDSRLRRAGGSINGRRQHE